MVWAAGSIKWIGSILGAFRIRKGGRAMKRTTGLRAHRTGFAAAIHSEAQRGLSTREAHTQLPELDALPKGRARLEQIKEIHARRQFNASRWVNWQIGTILAAGAKDLV